jgi:hypothetical protein
VRWVVGTWKQLTLIALQVSIYLSEQGHPTFGVIRTIVRDDSDSPGGDVYADSDGYINEDSSRNASAVRVCLSSLAPHKRSGLQPVQG